MADESLLGAAETPEQIAAADTAALAAAATPEAKAEVQKTIDARKTPEQREADALATAKTPEEKAAAQKAVDERKAATAVPEKYEFKLPDGAKLDDKLVEAVTPIFKDLKLTQAAADKLIAFHTQQTQAQQKQYTDQIAAWREEFSEDPKHTELLVDAKRTISKFAAPEMKSLLENEYFGNHPTLLRFLARIGATLKEDKIVEGRQSGAGSGERKADAEVIYGGK